MRSRQRRTNQEDHDYSDLGDRGVAQTFDYGISLHARRPVFPPSPWDLQ